MLNMPKHYLLKDTVEIISK